MAYFDSSKNRALWEIRLGELKRERAAREAGGSSGPLTNQPVKEAGNPYRVRVTYQELLKKEAEATKKSAGRRPRAMEREKDKSRLSERAKEAAGYEMG